MKVVFLVEGFLHEARQIAALGALIEVRARPRIVLIHLTVRTEGVGRRELVTLDLLGGLNHQLIYKIIINTKEACIL